MRELKRNKNPGIIFELQNNSFEIQLAPNRIPFGGKSIGKV